MSTFGGFRAAERFSCSAFARGLAILEASGTVLRSSSTMTAHIRLVSPPGEERRDLEGEGAEADEAPLGFRRSPAARPPTRMRRLVPGAPEKTIARGTGSLAMRRLRSSPSRRIARVAVPARRPVAKRASSASSAFPGGGRRGLRRRPRRPRANRATGGEPEQAERPPRRRDRIEDRAGLRLQSMRAWTSLSRA